MPEAYASTAAPLATLAVRAAFFTPCAATLRLSFPGSLLQMCYLVSFQDRKFEAGKEKEEWDLALLSCGLSQ